MRILFAFLFLCTVAHAQTLDLLTTPVAKTVCSNAPTAAPVTQLNATQWQVDIKTTGTLTDGQCNPTPPPVGCLKPPLVPGPNGSFYSRLTQGVTATYAAFGSKQIDPTKFSSAFTTPGISDKPWPSSYDAVPTSPLIASVKKADGNYTNGDYMSEAFESTAPYLADNPNVQGQYLINESSFNASISMTISTACGDFGQLSPTTIVKGCVLNAGIAGSRLLWYGPNGKTCALKDGVQYYLNIVNGNIGALTPGGSGVVVSTAQPNCYGNVCTIPLQNGPGSWPH